MSKQSLEPHARDAVIVPMPNWSGSWPYDGMRRTISDVLFKGSDDDLSDVQMRELHLDKWCKRIDDGSYIVYTTRWQKLYVVYEKKTGVCGVNSLTGSGRYLFVTRPETEIGGSCYWSDYFERAEAHMIEIGVLAFIVESRMVQTGIKIVHA